MAQPLLPGWCGLPRGQRGKGETLWAVQSQGRGDGGKHPGCCSSECSGGSAAAAAVAPSGNKRSQGGRGEVRLSPKQPQRLWLTESLEHMADTLLGTSRLGRRGTLQGIHSFIENTFIYYLFFIIYFSYFSYLFVHLPTFCQALEVLESQDRVEISIEPSLGNVIL